MSYNSDVVFYEDENLPFYWGGENKYVLLVPSHILFSKPLEMFCGDPTRPEIYKNGTPYKLFDRGLDFQPSIGWQSPFPEK